MPDSEKRMNILRQFGVLGTNAHDLLQALDAVDKPVIITVEHKALVELTHLALCKEDHNTTCHFHKEEEFDQTWDRPSHVAWLKKTADLMEVHRLDEEALRHVLREILALSEPAFNIAVEFGVFKK